MTSDEFVSLVEKLSKLGAIRVKAYEFDVQLHPAVLAAQVATPKKPAELVAIRQSKPQTPEEERLAKFREELGE